MTIAKTAIVVGMLLLLVVFLLARVDRKRGRVLVVEPTWRNAECIGDGACNWDAPRSARISKMHEPRGM